MGPETNSGGERIRRNVNISGRRTSVSLETAVWDALADICKRERVSLVELLTRIDTGRLEASLASALRVFVLAYFRTLASIKLDGMKRKADGLDGHAFDVLGRVIAEFQSTRRVIMRPTKPRR
jgi:predicted DNA-binding ribbon-helix-helix protein